MKRVNNRKPAVDYVLSRSMESGVKTGFKAHLSGTLLLIGVGILIVLALGGWLIFSRVRVYELIIATGPETGRAYKFGTDLAQVVAEAEPRLRLKVLATEGSVENMQLLQSGKVDLAIAQTDVDAGSQIRTVAYIYPELFQLAVRVGLDVKSPADLKGLRVATPPESSGSYNSFQAVMLHYGLTPENVTVVPLKAEEINPAFYDGKVDAVFRNLPLGEQMTAELLGSGQAQLVPFDQIPAMRIRKTYLMGLQIPKGTYHASDPAVPADDLVTVGVQNVIFANANVPSDLVRSITRVLFEHQNALVHLNENAAFISSPLDYEDAMGPTLHDGALAYYDREKPNFIQQYYDEITMAVMVIPLFGSAFLAFRSRMQARQKKQVDEYNQEIGELLVEVNQVTNLAAANAVEHKLMEVLCKVVNDLDSGQIEMEDLQTFTFIWDKAIAAVQHKQSMFAGQNA